MKTGYKWQIRVSLEQLNHIYGRGSVGTICRFTDGKVEWLQLSYGMKPVKRIARFNGNTLFALGHQITIKA